MELTVQSGNPLRGRVSSGEELSLPGDKSLSHRAAIFAGLASGECKIDGFQVSGVTRAMLDALSLLGVPWSLESQCLTVEGRGIRGYATPTRPIDCGNSATTIRLLAGALAASGTAAVLDGSPGLRRRPMDRIVVPLRQMGVDIEDTDRCAPLTLGRSDVPLRPLVYDMPVASAQVKTCLLLAALSAQGETVLREPGPSRDHTERMLRSFGIPIESQLWETQTASIPSASTYTTRLFNQKVSVSIPGFNMRLPGDPSAAAFMIVAALITPGSHIRLEDVLLNPTRTGLLDALKAMGADLEWTVTGNENGEPVGSIEACYSELKATEVEGLLVVRMIDEFPAFAVAAACAHGQTIVRNAEELRTKESDRISALVEELGKIGIDAGETPDGFVIRGGKPVQGGRVHPHGDHRLAMSLAVAGLIAENPVTVMDAQLVAESFPAFTDILAHLGADIVLR